MSLVGLTSDAAGALEHLEAFGANGTPATKFSSAIGLAPIPGAQFIAAIPSVLKLAGFGKAATMPNPLPIDRWAWYQPGGVLWGVPLHVDDLIWALRFARLHHVPGLFHPTGESIRTPMEWRPGGHEFSGGLICKGGGGLAGTKDVHLSCSWKEWHLRGGWREAFITPDGTGRWGFAPGPFDNAPGFSGGKEPFRMGQFVNPPADQNVEVTEEWLKKTVTRIKKQRDAHEGKAPVFIDVDARSWLHFARGAFAHHCGTGRWHFALNSAGKTRPTTVFSQPVPGPVPTSMFLLPLSDQFNLWLASEHGAQAKAFWAARMKNHEARRKVELEAWKIWKAQLAHNKALEEAAAQNVAAKIPLPDVALAPQALVPNTVKAKTSTTVKVAAAGGIGALGALLLL